MSSDEKRPISACDPFALEVHRAIDAAGDAGRLSPLPDYVERAHDRRMRKIADQALSGASRMITMVGGSSTGKTRACWELAQYVERQQPGPWRIWHPYDPTRPEAAAEAIGRIGPHTIVWLNEAQLYLAASRENLGERVAAGLRTLLADPARGPVLILATMWPGHWTALTTRPVEDGFSDPHGQARELLSATDIDVPSAFTATDLTTLKESVDPRLRYAGEHATGGRITQYLAGAPLLLERYRTAPPAARAVLDVAIDARRLGYLAVIPHALLEQAAWGYFDDEEWDHLETGWFEEALAYAAEPCNGTRGLLTPNRPRPGEPVSSGSPSYRLADFVEQVGITLRAAFYPPSSFWKAASSTISEPTALHVLGWAAEQRGRYQHAHDLYRASTDHGGQGIFRASLRVLKQAGAAHSVAELCRHAAVHDDVDALNHLAFAHERSREFDSAASLYRQSADLGDPAALRALARLSARAGDSAAAARLDRAAADFDDATRYTVAQRGERAGDLDRAPRLYRDATDRSRGIIGQRSPVARVHQQADNRATELARTVSSARQAAERGQTNILANLALQIEWNGDSPTAERLAREAADHGNPIVLSQLARRRELAGDLDGAAGFYLEAADRGNINALVNLARIREQAGDAEGADRIRKFGLDAAGLPAERWAR